MKKLLRLVKEQKGTLKLLPDGRIVLRKEEKGRELMATIRKVLMEIAPL